MQVHFMRSVKKVANRLKECFVSLGYAVLDAETEDEVETLFKVLSDEGALEMVSEFLPRSAQQYMGKHNPAHWSITAQEKKLDQEVSLRVAAKRR